MISFVSSAQLQSADSEALQETSTGPGSVGRSLHGQPVEIWRSGLMKLSEGQSIVDSETDLRKCLQSSLDALNDEDVMQKECFMDFSRNDASEIDGCYSGAFVMQHAFFALSLISSQVCFLPLGFPLYFFIFTVCYFFFF